MKCINCKLVLWLNVNFSDNNNFFSNFRNIVYIGYLFGLYLYKFIKVQYRYFILLYNIELYKEGYKKGYE